MSDPNNSKEQPSARPGIFRKERIVFAVILVVIALIVSAIVGVLTKHDQASSDDDDDGRMTYTYTSECRLDETLPGLVYNIFSKQSESALDTVDLSDYPHDACISEQGAVELGQRLLTEFNAAIIRHNAALDEYIAAYRARAATIDGDLTARLQQLADLECGDSQYPDDDGSYWFSDLATFGAATLKDPPFGYDHQNSPYPMEPKPEQTFMVGKNDPAAYTVVLAERDRVLAGLLGDHLSFTC